MKNTKFIALLASIICLPLFGIIKEDPATNKRNYEQETQAAHKRRKQKNPQQLLPLPITTTTTTTTAALPVYEVYWWTPIEHLN